jgi:hypothetical protein
LSGVRTVVVSDLHLGSRSEADVLRRRAPRDKLVERVEGADRLVLLGDTIELRQGPAREAMAVAQPVLEELGGALGKGGEVILVAGNHDHALVAPWLERRGAHVEPPPLNLEEHPGPSASAATEAIAQWLKPARRSSSALKSARTGPRPSALMPEMPSGRIPASSRPRSGL